MDSLLSFRNISVYLYGIYVIIVNLADSIKNNLLVEERYRMILDGLQVTLLITLCAAVLGTLLGGVFEESQNNLAVTLLRHFSREIKIEGDTVRIMINSL